MSKRNALYLVMTALSMVLIISSCKKGPSEPTKEEVQNALRNIPEIVNTVAVDSVAGRAIIGNMDAFMQLPIFGGMSKSGLLKTAIQGKKELARYFFQCLTQNCPWDTLAGRWRWYEAPSPGHWEHYSTTPTDSMLFEMTWADTATSELHNLVFCFSNWACEDISGENVLTDFMVDFWIDDINHVHITFHTEYGYTEDDIRKIDIEMRFDDLDIEFYFDYEPPNIEISYRMEVAGEWFKIEVMLQDSVPPADETVIETLVYTDYRGWRVDIAFQDPDEDGIQLLSGEVTRNGEHGAYIHSEKRYGNGIPILYAWIEYPDGSTEPLEELLADLLPQGGY